MDKNELLELYNHRFGAGFSMIYANLSEEEKKEFTIIAAAEDVKNWRKEGTLIGRICGFTSEEKEKYLSFIELDEFYKAILQYWIIKRIVDLKSKKATEESIQSQIQKLTQDQKASAISFLTQELNDPSKASYKKEIESILALLKNSNSYPNSQR